MDFAGVAFLLEAEDVLAFAGAVLAFAGAAFLPEAEDLDLAGAVFDLEAEAVDVFAAVFDADLGAGLLVAGAAFFAGAELTVTVFGFGEVAVLRAGADTAEFAGFAGAAFGAEASAPFLS